MPLPAKVNGTPRMTRSLHRTQSADNKRPLPSLNIVRTIKTKVTSISTFQDLAELENDESNTMPAAEQLKTLQTPNKTVTENLNISKSALSSKPWLDTSLFDLLQNKQATNTANVPTAKRRKQENDVETVVNSKNVTNTKILDNANWMKSFEPTTQEEIAVHPKKLTELNNWFQHCNVVRARYPAQLCLLTGPTGAGKTAAIQVLAKANKYQIVEWINPLEQEVSITLGDGKDSAFAESQLDAFKSFLFRASRYQSLLERQHKRLLLVEDFPNKLLNDAQTFDSILCEFMSFGKSPLVFIVADSKSRGLNISHNLFTDEIQQKYGIVHVNFNAIAATFMQSAMKRFCSIISQQSGNYKVPTQAVTDSIIVSSQGDIRNALINLHFAALKGAPTLAMSELQNLPQKTAKRKKQNTLKSIGCDDSTNIMHSLGRVFNPKYTAEQRLLHSPESLAEAFSTQPQTFLDLVHANYLPHFREIEHTMQAADGISCADMLLQEYRDENLPLTALTLGVRSVMIANKQPVSAWLPVRGVKRMQQVHTTDAELQLMGSHNNISRGLYASEYKSFTKIISKASNKLHLS